MSEERAYAYDVFVSYSHDDEDWVEKALLPRLEGAGLRVCIDFRDFVPGKVALLYVSNLSRRPVEASLALNFADLGLANVNAADGENDAQLAVAGNRLRVHIPWHDYRMIKLTPR